MNIRRRLMFIPNYPNGSVGVYCVYWEYRVLGMYKCIGYVNCDV